MKKVTYFTLQELIESSTAKSRRIDNTPSFDVVEHLNELCCVILDPLRKAWGSAIVVNSGYRSEALNRAIPGSSATSVHKLGYAVDIRPKNGDFVGFVKFVKEWVTKNNIPFDQILIETSNTSRWVHIGLYNNEGRQRRIIKNMTV